jgi:hypothetical protein
MNQNEFDSLLADTTKRVSSDITWFDDEDHSPSVEFRVEVDTDAGYPLFIRGSYNTLAGTLTYALIHRSFGRIHGLDLGKDHHNPDCTYVGEKHKHRWSEAQRDKEAYAPPDITAPVTDPITVWRQFCDEAHITHDGVMHQPHNLQLEIL